MQIKQIARIAAVATALFAAQAHAATNLIVDGGFDIGSSFGTYNYANNFHGTMTGKGSPWTFSDASGVVNHAGAWGGVASTSTVAFIQNYNGFTSNTPTVSQTFSSSASAYTVTFDLAQRPGNHESLQVSLDGQILSGGLLTPAGASLTSYSYTVTGLTGTSHTLQFKGVNNSGAYDSSLFLDNVNVAAVPEPETYAMMMAGLALVGVVARRRKAQKAA
ncbi:FxDxF family PEP-CTERM protein [Duganella qianjiadongensis]|uniref:PEP-CTERM sorting domain-containing protein n=1 Tax=Duganella qianjiadongensis TaxID=2692176 RepID=A0ABW9VJS0_9BURK|nr:FxDxF family PEP-CTERM protein [Duganella qianjiadongensis]MYM39838.1 PEP-CTERM sorting domain-containing protein [Duganella qianjiadongensis]